MYTSAECREIAAAKLGQAEFLPDERRANRFISAANAWLILAHGVRTYEIRKEVARERLAAK
jgi:hypothetical protein